MDHLIHDYCCRHKIEIIIHFNWKIWIVMAKLTLKTCCWKVNKFKSTQCSAFTVTSLIFKGLKEILIIFAGIKRDQYKLMPNFFKIIIVKETESQAAEPSHKMSCWAIPCCWADMNWTKLLKLSSLHKALKLVLPIFFLAKQDLVHCAFT